MLTPLGICPTVLLMDEITAQRWGRAIRERRELLKMTQDDLAHAIKARQSTVSRWERGERVPSHHYVPRIAHALKTTPELLFVYTNIVAAA